MGVAHYGPRTDSYWLGTFVMTAALASKRTDPARLLRSTVDEFLRERPAGDPLKSEVLNALRERP